MNYEKEDSRAPGPDLNQGPPEFEPEVLTQETVTFVH
jgi:hypothetical protein